MIRIYESKIEPLCLDRSGSILITGDYVFIVGRVGTTSYSSIKEMVMKAPISIYRPPMWRILLDNGEEQWNLNLELSL